MEEVQREADQRKRNMLIASGIPAHQVEGAKVHSYETNIRHIRRPVQSIVDKWLREFDEAQGKAIGHVILLWRAAGDDKLVANLDWIGGGGGGRERGREQADALAQLAHYRREFLNYWGIFEDVVRWNTPASVAGEHIASNGRRSEKCRLVVGFVASKIAELQRY